MSGEQPWNVPNARAYRVEHRSSIQKRPSSITDDQHWELMMHCWMEEPTLRLTAEEALATVKKWVVELEDRQQGD